MDGREAEVEAALDRFVSTNLSEAERGCEQLVALTEPALKSFLRRFLNAADTDEVLVDTWARLWTNRGKFQPRGAKAWYAYAKRVAWRCLIDLAKSRLSTDENVEELIDRERRVLDYLERILDDEGFFDRLAAETWCGYDHRLPQVERDRRVTAAKYFFVHRKSIEEICQTVLPRVPRKKAEAELEKWLTDRAVLLDFAFRHIYRSGYSLTCHLLDLDQDLKQDCLQPLLKATEAAKETEAPGGWPWHEIPGIIYRYNYGMSPSQTCIQAPHLTLEDVSNIDDRCRVKFPFIDSVSFLAAIFKDKKDLLSKNPLWYRLTYHHWYRDEISQKDILARLAEAAAKGDKKLNAGQLNVWIGNRRLAEAMFNTWEKRR